MPDSPTEIVVIAELNAQGGVASFRTLSIAEYNSFQSQRELDPNGEPEAPFVAVRVSVQNPANSERAQQAARRLAVAIARELQRLEAADPNARVVVLGRSCSIGDLLFELNNTDFVVTDRADFENNGVGASSRGQYGARNTDIINMDAIIDGYGTQPNDIGLRVLIFHELAHMSQVGYDFFILSAGLHGSEPADKRGPFYPSDYSRNNEAFANDLKDKVHEILGIEEGFDPGGFSGATEPALIYIGHLNSWAE